MTPSLDLDFGARGRAGTLVLTEVLSVDQISGQREALIARGELAVRLEPRVTRALRLSLGVVSGVLLRRLPVLTTERETLRLGGLYVGVEAGFVFTPPGVQTK